MTDAVEKGQLNERPGVTYPIPRGPNPLLLKHDVGRAKPTCFDLPPQSHAYGKEGKAQVEGAREVTTLWKHHVPRPRAEEQTLDFRRLNKIAVANHILDPKGLNKQSKERSDVTIKPISYQHCAKWNPADEDPAFVFGKKTRASTPMSRVMSFHYAKVAEDMLVQRYEKEAKERDNRVLSHKIKLTKSARGHAHHLDVSPRGARGRTGYGQEPFKMKKFRKTPAKVDTHVVAARAGSSPARHPESSEVERAEKEETVVPNSKVGEGEKEKERESGRGRGRERERDDHHHHHN